MTLAPAVIKERVGNVRDLLGRMKADIGNALPAHLTADRMIRVALTAIQTTPKLLECDQRSLLQAIMTASQLGLEPDGVLGQAYLVPYGDKVQFIPGYKGLISLAYNSGEVASLHADVVHERDFFSYEYGIDEHLRHRPAKGDRGAVVEFYAYCKLKNGAFAFEVMSLSEVEAIRDASQGFKAYQRNKAKYPNTTTPWVEHFVQMGRKTLIRRLANYLPRSVQKATQIEGAFEGGKPAALNDLGEVILLEGTAEEPEAGGEAAPEKAPPAEKAKRNTRSRMDALASGPAETVDPDTGEVTETVTPAATKAPGPVAEEEPEIPAFLRRAEEPAPAAASGPVLFGDD